METPANLVQSKKKIQDNKVSLSAANSMYKDYFAKLSKLDDNDIIVRTNCKFCLHPARADAEEVWEKRKNYALVEKFFDSYKEENPDAPKMTFVNIKAHLQNHYAQQQKSMWLKEYSDRVLSMMNQQMDAQHRLSLLSNQIQMKFNEIAADPNVDIAKQADTMAKLAKSIMDCETTIAKFRGELQTVNIVTEKLTTVWVNKITNEKDENVRKALMDTLDQFQGQLEGVPLVEQE